MASKSKVVSIGYAIPGENGTEPFSSKLSLLEGDIAIIEPSIAEFLMDYERRQARPVLGLDASAHLRAAINHWRADTIAALKAGKVVVVFMRDVERALLSGGLTHEEVTNYDWLPMTLGLHSARGVDVTPTDKGNAIRPYWERFGSQSEYEVYFENVIGVPILATRSGNRVVGVAAPGRGGVGWLLLIPPLRYDDESFTDVLADGSECWNSSACRFGKEFCQKVVELGRELCDLSEKTPPPAWANDAAYLSNRSRELGAEIANKRQELAALSEALAALEGERDAEFNLNGLLYENGVPLEEAVLEALGILGFQAERYKENGSEFDAVFASAEGRFLGEAEGKDNKPIGIDKLRQLAMNIDEDFRRDEVSTPAKGVLFGNAFRLGEPGKRGLFFTEKCLKAASSFGYSLVRMSPPELLSPIATGIAGDRAPDDLRSGEKLAAARGGPRVASREG